MGTINPNQSGGVPPPVPTNSQNSTNQPPPQGTSGPTDTMGQSQQVKGGASFNAQVPEITILDYQKTVGESTKNLEKMLAKLEALNTEVAKKLSTYLKQLAIDLLNEIKQAPPPPPGQGAGGGFGPGPGGLGGPGGLYNPGNPYAAQNSRIYAELAIALASQSATQDNLSAQGAGKVNAMMFFTDPITAATMNYQNNVSDLANVKKPGEAEIGKGQTNFDDPAIHKVFGSQQPEALNTLVGPTLAKHAQSLVKVLGIQIAAHLGLAAGHGAVKALGAHSKGVNFDHPATNTAATVSLVHNLTQLAGNNQALESLIRNVVAGDKQLNALPETTKESLIGLLTQQLRGSLIKTALVQTQDGLKIKNLSSNLLGNFSGISSNNPVVDEFAAKSNTQAHVQAVLPPGDNEAVSQLFEEASARSDGTPGGFITQLNALFKESGSTPDVAATSASKVGVYLLLGTKEGQSALGGASKNDVNSLQQSLATLLQQGTPLQNTPEVATQLQAQLQSHGTNASTAQTLSTNVLNLLGNNAPTTSSEEDNTVQVDTTSTSVDEQGNVTQTTSSQSTSDQSTTQTNVQDQAQVASEQPPADQTDTAVVAKASTAGSTPKVSQNADVTQQPTLNANEEVTAQTDETAGFTPGNNQKAVETGQAIHDQVVSMIVDIVGEEQATKIADKFLEVVTGYPSVDAIRKNERTNPQSLTRLAQDQVHWNIKSNFRERTTQKQEAVITENFRTFIKAHSDLSTWAEQLRSPAKALVMAWSLMNQGTFKFSGRSSALDVQA